MVACAYEEHNGYPVLLHKIELEERDCLDQFKDQLVDQRWINQQLRHRVAQLSQLNTPAGEAVTSGARFVELVKENEELKQSVAMHRAEVRMGK